ncbi:MAG: hypothetical protein GWN73_17410, partial [Actinobacteria bacterium]|nr:hypothetical protein [Actinomycetota bacterium]NIU67106.1 hypothetical protein [Actinomycetota bacterium]
SGHEPASSEPLEEGAEWSLPAEANDALAAPLQAAIGDAYSIGEVHEALGRTLNIVQDRSGRSYVDVIVRTASTEAGVVQHVRSTGMNVTTVQHRANLVMGSVPIDALEALGRVPGVESVEPARPMTQLLDLSVPPSTT